MTEYEYKGKTYTSYNELLMEKYRRMLWVSKNKPTDDEFIRRFENLVENLHSRNIMVNGYDMSLNRRTSPW